MSAERAAELAPDTRPSVAPGDPVAARADGYARCQADVVTHYTASPDDMEIDDFVESVDLGGHVGAAARAKEKP